MTIIAVAGRRIDAENAEKSRFPLGNIPLVQERMQEYLARVGATHVVASAACGADLIALNAALAAGLSLRVILPFERATFRGTSVTDRPGNWGPIYDEIIAEAAAAGDLVELGLPEDETAYEAANQRILVETARLADQDSRERRVCIIWEGGLPRQNDHSFLLAQGARARGWLVDDRAVLTI